ncbi:uncharacterized protein LOC125241509 [Leguminivora glycinivorella]|uniref:uncharacterized protein LOC125241509 n=1 Tax=Leguminivora glycinivorella TaxID=1035111 RepID=UPI0020102F81|nr:uncharacterized protein LOC125241509 [Leguminivora glycinivorella]
MGDLQQTYDQIKKAGKNSVDGIIMWLQESKIIDKAKGSEDKVRKYFDDAANKSEITAEKFKQAVGEIAKEQKKNVEELSKKLAEHGSTLMNALQAGAQAAAVAFKESMDKKK